MKKISSAILRIGITLVLLIFLFGKVDFKGLMSILRQADLFLAVAAFLLFFFLNLLCLARWHLLLKGIGMKIPLARLFLSYLSSQFFNLIFPSTIGGDTVRTLDIARYTRTHSSGILATVALDRAAGFFGLITVLAFALLFGFRILGDPNILIVALILLSVVAFLVGILFFARFFDLIFKFLPFKTVKTYLYKIHEATASYKKKKGTLLAVWFLSIFIQAGLAVMFYWLALAVGVNIPLIYFLILVPVITAISVIPISVGGLGVRDTATVVLLGKVGVAAEKALAVSLANFGVMLLLGLAGAACYVFSLYRRRV